MIIWPKRRQWSLIIQLGNFYGMNDQLRGYWSLQRRVITMHSIACMRPYSHLTMLRSVAVMEHQKLFCTTDLFQEENSINRAHHTRRSSTEYLLQLYGSNQRDRVCKSPEENHTSNSRLIAIFHFRFLHKVM